MNYNNSYIYKLSCKDKNITDCYVGSTTNFKQRKQQHKTACCNENDRHHHFKVYQFIRNNGGFDNWSMILLEKVKVNDKQELHKLERKYIEQLNSTLNCVIPTRNIKEWYKEYYENNKEKVKEINKEYREDNKEYFKEYRKEYYKNNKEIIYEKRKVKIECEFCKSFVRKDYLKTHRKTNKCIEARKKN